ncbi:hypothetical protein KBK24_0132410 [Burkholderia sp. K24]|nr:hypothetical protein KBK24_0132410 [Burkholderia sp. K24]
MAIPIQYRDGAAVLDARFAQAAGEARDTLAQSGVGHPELVPLDDLLVLHLYRLQSQIGWQAWMAGECCLVFFGLLR